MKIEIPRKGYAGDKEIKQGEYLVSISPESSAIVLVGGGGEIKIKATRRPSKVPVKRARVTFAPSMGDPFWVLSFFLPPRTEWVAFVKLERRQEGD